MQAFLILVSLVTVYGGRTIRREKDICDQVLADFDECGRQTYNDYKKAFEAGDDGKPDWMARKSCNYMTASIEGCGNKMKAEGCNTEEEVTEMKDQQIEGILDQLQSSVVEWDSEKCPPVKAHIERMKAALDVDDNGVESDEVYAVSTNPDALPLSDVCVQVQADFDECGQQAYNDYKKAFEAGDDGKPDWMARKSCNYMTASIEGCGNKLKAEGCNTEEEVTEMKDQQIEGIIDQLQSSFVEWDSEKCPPVKAHIERMKAALDVVEDDGVKAEDEVYAVSTNPDALPLTMFFYVVNTLYTIVAVCSPIIALAANILHV